MTNHLVMLGITMPRGIVLNQFINSRDEVTRSLFHAGQLADPSVCQVAGHRVDHNRDKIVDFFMKHPQQPDWLLFLDSDMEFPPDIGQRLTRWQKPVVSGLYFQRGDWFPMAFGAPKIVTNAWGESEHRFPWKEVEVLDYLERHDVPMTNGVFALDGDDGLLPCEAVASGALCIHRSVLTAMKPPWFQIRDGNMTDDFQFCLRVRQELNLPIFCDLSTICGHYMEIATGQKEFREMMRKEGSSGESL